MAGLGHYYLGKNAAGVSGKADKKHSWPWPAPEACGMTTGLSMQT